MISPCKAFLTFGVALQSDLTVALRLAPHALHGVLQKSSNSFIFMVRRDAATVPMRGNLKFLETLADMSGTFGFARTLHAA
jgi:hypothetical protein